MNPFRLLLVIALLGQPFFSEKSTLGLWDSTFRQSTWNRVTCEAIVPFSWLFGSHSFDRQANPKEKVAAIIRAAAVSLGKPEKGIPVALEILERLQSQLSLEFHVFENSEGKDFLERLSFLTKELKKLEENMTHRLMHISGLLRIQSQLQIGFSRFGNDLLANRGIKVVSLDARETGVISDLKRTIQLWRWTTLHGGWFRASFSARLFDLERAGLLPMKGTLSADDDVRSALERLKKLTGESDLLEIAHLMEARWRLLQEPEDGRQIWNGRSLKVWGKLYDALWNKNGAFKNVLAVSG